MSEIHQIHPSGLRTLSKCGLQYYFSYIERVKIPPAARLLSGSSAHYGRQIDLDSRLKTGELLESEELEDLVVSDFSERWERADVVDVDEDVRGDPRDYYLDKTVELTELHHQKLAPRLEPLEVERPFVLEWAGLGYQVAGTVDLLEVGEVVSDLKNRSKSPSQGEAETSLQLSVYAVAHQARFGSLPRVRLDVAVATMTKTKLVQIDAERGPEVVPMVEQRVVRAANVIDSGLFTPADPESWWCSARWCGYFEPREGFRGCPYATRPVSTGGGSNG